MSYYKNGRQPKTYGKRNNTSSYLNPCFDRVSPHKRSLHDCNGAGDVRSVAEPGLEQDNSSQTCSLEATFQQLVVTTKEENRTPSIRHQSPLSPKAANIQATPEKARSKANLDLGSVKQSQRTKDVVTSVRQPCETGHDADIGADKGEQQPSNERISGEQVQARKTSKCRSRTKHDDDEFAYVRPLLCLFDDNSAERKVPDDFQTWADELDDLFSVEKIAEASYGEVYRLNMADRSTELKFGASDESVLKVIPLKSLVSHRRKKLETLQMSAVEDVLTEAQTLMRMTVVPGFTNLRDIRVMRGRLPRQFVRAWKAYLRDGTESHFPDPSKSGTYTKDQLWAVIEMQNAGVDVEKFVLQNTIQIWDIFWSVAMALAKGEELAKFEHRDLHLGNICVRPRNDEAHESSRQVNPGNSDLNIGHSNLKISLIDYTLSRVEMEELDESGANRTAYLDLDKDPALFAGVGEYQYDIYRFMRSALYRGDPLAVLDENQPTATGRGWDSFQPLTNVLWLHYILVALREQLASIQPSGPKRKQKLDRSDLNNIYRQRLASLEKVLNPRTQKKQWGKRCGTARAVMEYGMEQGWLSERDIIEYDSDEDHTLG